jgi:two-component system, sensor histidine kinase and response regulator
MTERKDLVASAISKAQADLEEAMSELQKLPAFDPGSVAFAAHALSNYLTVTGGALELIGLRLIDHPDPQIRAWVEGAQHATNLMTRIVNQLRDGGTTEESQIRFEKVDLPVLVHRVCSYYQRVADRKGIRVTAGSADDVPAVRTDRVQVAAVLDNLLSNAIKYSPPDKRILAEVREDEGGCVVCSVQDEGPGLTEEDQAKLFQRGARLTPRPTGGEPSTGYGLAVARELMERLGGTIWCESVLGEGTRFSFRLPAYREQTEASRA